MEFAFKSQLSPQWVQGLGLLAAIAGLATWGVVLFTPETAAPMQEATVPIQAQPAAAAQWFANRPAQVDIVVSGLLAAGKGTVAVLSVNGGAAQAVRVGELLAQGVRLVAIEADGLIIERGHERSKVSIAQLPQPPALPSLIRP
ncbi:general secretion pathway protein GspC [Pseudomonas fontis]|uniref:General secretion pathway protein GspC n=1 Tax=Pseudomonas fontis TaxID=2942633 RepID=A0ABT5NPU7_9PSED|nr:general secretion pathway protein GspC [Pseudomonas fontis]MDD0974706.1 general secretion pathway protein GspC [Pseudomonas fontis]MDD0990201.1 general secretion pathway protein GspC [Pseudomonas fontis]